jgi:membrane protease YdiL (CAAX protease family)
MRKFTTIMTNFDTSSSQTNLPFISKIMILVGLTLVFMAIGSAIGIFLFMQISGMPFTQVANFQKYINNYPNMYDAVMALQTFSAPVPFIAASFFFWIIIEKQPINALGFREVELPVFFLVALLVIVFMFFDALIIEWNQGVVFPESLKGIENWMKKSEESAGELTKFLTDFKTPSQLIVAMIVVAVLAGVSEELLFRGVLQNITLRAFGNPHVAIWFAAFVFSFIHLQFYGFFPRMFLGALFGYLYYWTKNIWVPVFAHFVNNGFTLLMAYLYSTKAVEVNIEDTKSVPLTMAIGSLLLTAMIMRWFWGKRVVS